jgi:hypothetical protein
MTHTVNRSWTDIVRQADPDWDKTSRMQVEYEFPSRVQSGDERTHEGGRRVFRGAQATRGPYATEAAGDSGLVWGGVPMDWNGQPLVWGEED